MPGDRPAADLQPWEWPENHWRGPVDRARRTPGCPDYSAPLGLER
jgi:hypothetical protein